MYDTILEQTVSIDSIRNGLSLLAGAVSAVYGTDRLICAVNSEGRSICTSNIKTLIAQAKFHNIDAERVRLLLAGCELPEKGTDTAIILANEYVEYAFTQGIGRDSFREILRVITEAGTAELSIIAKHNKGLLAGNGLFLMNIQRRVYRVLREHWVDKKSVGFIHAFEKPLLIQALNCGRQPQEVFSRIQAVAPTQFYSLEHYGLGRSIPTTDDRDLWRFGLASDTRKITDLFDKGVVIKEEQAQEILTTAYAISIALSDVGYCL